MHVYPQHSSNISFIYKEGNSTLPPFLAFLSKFPNDFTSHHTPSSIMASLHWWEAVLAKSNCSHSLKPHLTIDPDIWVNASSSWGISIIFSMAWYAWSLIPGWRTNVRDISWAETTALE